MQFVISTVLLTSYLDINVFNVQQPKIEPGDSEFESLWVSRLPGSLNPGLDFVLPGK